MAASVHVQLTGHRANPARFHQHVEVIATRLADGALALAYRINGLNLDLHVPTPHAPAPVNELWRTTCCELFIAPAGQTAYREFNFSPSGQWATYDFLDYRARRQGDSACIGPTLQTQRTEELLQLDVMLPASVLTDMPDKRLLAGITVILAAQDGSTGYWALVHPPGQPDFHHRSGFALQLDAHGFHA